MELSSILLWLQNGFAEASLAAIVLYALLVTHITILSVTLYLHRHSAHRSLDLHPALQHFFRFWLWLTTGMVTKEWTAIHRKHHAVCETEDDPHSPQIFGIKTVLLRGSELYRTSRNPEMLARFGRGTPDDWLERNVYSRYSALGITLLALIDVALFGAIGLTVWAVQMLWIPFFAAGVVNGIGHYWGYRNFECPDAATNIVPWGVLIGGEELHNNHHTYPNSAKFSVKPWELDLGWLWIRMLGKLGLAKARSTGPVVARDPERKVIDTNTVWAVLNDRFLVMANYAEQVVKPLVEYEYHRADGATRRLFKRAKGLLCREETLVGAEEQARISDIVTVSPRLRTIYEMRQRLQQVWAKRSGDSEELIRDFKQWCADAEASGIEALREFVEDLKSYTMPSAARA